jgi:hypothetical protein
MEDAVVLAMALRDAPSIDQALVDYEAARRERVEKVVAYGARSSSAKIPGGRSAGPPATRSCASRSATSSPIEVSTGCTVIGSTGMGRCGPLDGPLRPFDRSIPLG